MTLEDFFTLSEMKDGLAALNRVEELLSVMQNQDCVKGLVGDAARQWTTVANILAITENEDCLDHFIQSNGLSFLRNWLHEAQKCSDDNSDCSVEELITALLRALDKLPVDKEKLSASRVGVTVKQLHGHMSHTIQEKARTLCDKWKHVEDKDSEHQAVDENGPACDDGDKHSTETINAEGLQSNTDPKISPSDKVSNENAKTCSNSSPADTAEDAEVSSNQISFPSTLNSSERKEDLGEMNIVASSRVFNPCEENLPIESVCPETGVASASKCDSPVSRGGNVELPDVSDGKDIADGPEDMDIEVNMKEASPCKSSEKEMCFTSAESSFRKKGDIGTASEGKVDEGDLTLKGDKGVESKISSALKSPVNANTVSEMDQRRSEIGLEYGEIDALEVARQVAIEVEREVVDYREPFCSSSPEVISRGEIMESCSSDLAENKNDKPVGEQLSGNESPIRKHISDDSSPRNSTRTTADVDIKDSVHDPESPKSASVLQSVGNVDKNKCEFDLNEDVCSQENDSQMVPTANQTINLSAPILVAASKGAPSLPVTPLHFEGELGWRGSAATSAFRPASPRRTSDGEKTACGPKQKANFLQIDLNVAEGEDDVAVDHPSNKLSSCTSLDKSSTETSSRAERLEFDLNRIGDEDTLPNQPSHWRPSHQNENCSPSPASSSSSRQPSMRDFDLNDNPSLFDASGQNTSVKSSSKETSTYGSYKFDDPVITIMGSRMSVERKEPVNQAPRSFLGNGLGMDSAFRASAPYPPMPPHAYGYHGLQMGPPMPIPTALFGPGSIPYMVDSRGATVIPQILGSAGLSGATPTRPHFLMSVPGAPSGLNMVGGIPRPSLDLNAGTAPAEGGSKEMGSFKQLFMQGKSGLEDHMTSASQPPGPAMVLKRKEPDCGWEPYTFGPGYKQATSWQ